MPGIYIHIPFCKSKCSYCDFFSVANRESVDPVVDGIIAELKRERGFVDFTSIDTIYIGGGTPSVCSPTQIQSLIDTVRQLWECSTLSEITMEANPEDLTDDYLDQLTTTDINRLSIGIQSFDDNDLRLMRRRHSAQRAICAVQKAQQLGYKNITVDLIYGVPGMSAQVWERNIETAINLDIQHISAYHLSIEDNTRFAVMARRGEIAPIDEQQSQWQYMTLHDRLNRAGFDHYEISNFAREGFRAVHNSAYWRAEPYLGVGPSAHSFNGNVRRWSGHSIVDYLNGTEYQSEVLSTRDKYNEFVMTALRTKEGVDTALLKAKFGDDKLQYFIGKSKSAIANSFLTKCGDYFSIPYRHFLIADAIICDLFENN